LNNNDSPAESFSAISCVLYPPGTGENAHEVWLLAPSFAFGSPAVDCPAAAVYSWPLVNQARANLAGMKPT
jgi:hypothetical protein